MDNHSQHRETPSVSTQLLVQIQAMDPDGWKRLVQVFGPVVYKWCRTSGIPEADTPDLVQDIFASIARGISSFQKSKPIGSFRSWLATITRNRIRDYFRSASRREVATGGTGALQQLQNFLADADEDISGEAMLSPVLEQVVEIAKADFESITWQAFWATTIENQPASSVAADLSLSLASVYQAKSRVLRKLRSLLAELPE